MPADYSLSIQKIFEVQKQIEDLHPFLCQLFPVAIAEAGHFWIYDQLPGQFGYTLVQQAPLPMPIPAGVRAAFPLDLYQGRMACVVTGDIFEEGLKGMVTLFHEFVHCQQYENCEPRLKQSLKIARQAQATQDFMWEINHPFPYQDAVISSAYAKFIQSLDPGDLGEVIAARQTLKSLLQPQDFEYMVWQEWKEGFARSIENQICRRLGLEENFGGRTPPMDRVSFYAGGAGLIQALERQTPGLSFDLEALFHHILQL